MASRIFKFGPQPALDKAIDGQKVCEEALTEARRALEMEKQKLQKLLEKIAATQQQIRVQHDNLVSAMRRVSEARELSQKSQHLDSLREREKAEKRAAEQQREQIAFAADRVSLRKQELAEAMARVQALEKLKAKRLEEHETALEKADEKRRDDDAIQLWNNRPE